MTLPHLWADEETSPNDEPSHTSIVAIMYAYPSLRFRIPTYPIAVPAGTRTDSHALTSDREKQLVLIEPSIVEPGP